MARLWTSGAELQSATSGMEVVTVYDATIDTTTKHSGEASWKCAGSIAGTAAKGFDHPFSAGAATVFARWYVYIDALKAGTSIYLDLYSGATNVISVSIDNVAGVMTATPYYNNFGAALSTFTLSTDAWHYIEVEYDTSPANGSEVFKVRLDGVEQSASSSLTLTTKTVTIMSTGCYNSTGTADADTIVYFDDMAVNDGSGTAETSYPGEGYVVHMYPNAAGDVDGTLQTPNGYQGVDEQPTPDDATSIATHEVDGTFDVNLESSSDAGITSGSTIKLVQVGYRGAAANANSRAHVLRIKGQASGTTTESATLTVLSSAYQTNAPTPFIYKLTAYTNPQDSAAWETADLDQMQIGSRSTDSAPDIYLTSLWALVEYIPAVGGTAVKDFLGSGIIPFAR